jgi:hypothetical protein
MGSARLAPGGQLRRGYSAELQARKSLDNQGLLTQAELVSGMVVVAGLCFTHADTHTN